MISQKKAWLVFTFQFPRLLDKIEKQMRVTIGACLGCPCFYWQSVCLHGLCRCSWVTTAETGAKKLDSTQDSRHVSSCSRDSWYIKAISSIVIASNSQERAQSLAQVQGDRAVRACVLRIQSSFVLNAICPHCGPVSTQACSTCASHMHFKRNVLFLEEPAVR